MKIHAEYKGTVFEYEHRPMPPERFAAVCKLALPPMCVVWQSV